MSDDDTERIEGLGARELFRAALDGSGGDPEAAERAAEEERQVRTEIERHLPDLELLELLGRGGMGYVYRARQRKLDREVALKVVAPAGERQADFAQRFEREARTLARLSHPNIVAVHDYGQEGSFCWLLMEYVEGSNLRDVIRAGKLEPAEALALVPKLCSALQFAHDLGVVHRDVKPENILLDREGGVKIADFGLAKLVGTPAALVALTGSQQVLGTFRYMAPEQLDHPLEVDHRADIYSLGVVLYEMLTGELPMGRFDPPSLRSAASLELDEVVLRALEKAPERRYQRASEVQSDLESLGRGERSPRRAAEPGPERPRLSVRAVVSAALGGVALLPTPLLALAFLGWETSPHEIGEPVAGPPATHWALPPLRVSLAGLLVTASAALVLALLILGGLLGFRALREIRAAWPRLYGAGAAVVGAWTGVLGALNAALLIAALAAWGAPGEIPAWVPLATLGLLALDAAFLVWYRRRFLRGCRAG